ncbi:MAG: hypothetical protein RL367_1031 [Pseudomonadota bacterium]|jgi:hypothetical protein
MALPGFPIVDAFYDWLEELPKDHAVFAAASIMAVAKEGAYAAGCGDLGDGIWSCATTLGSPNLYMVIYIYSDAERFFPLHGVITCFADVRGEQLNEARRRLNKLRK